MSKRKKPDFATPEQEAIWMMMDSISNHATKSEKNTWSRKRKNIEDLVDNVQPIENEILILNTKAQELYDEIAKIRKDMIETCVHPFDMLEYKGNHVSCKFCYAKLSLPVRK